MTDISFTTPSEADYTPFEKAVKWDNVPRKDEHVVFVEGIFIAREIIWEDDGSVAIVIEPDNIEYWEDLQQSCRETERKLLIQQDQDREWVTDIAKQIGVSYGKLMKDAQQHQDHGEWIYINSDNYQKVFEESSTIWEFWTRYKRLTGNKVDHYEAIMYSCSISDRG